jgi:hypothetical protein
VISVLVSSSVSAAEQKDPKSMAAHTLHIVQAFEERDGGIVPRKSARPLAPHVPWQRALHRPTPVSSPGRESGIPILANGDRPKS